MIAKSKRGQSEVAEEPSDIAVAGIEAVEKPPEHGHLCAVCSKPGKPVYLVKTLTRDTSYRYSCTGRDVYDRPCRFFRDIRATLTTKPPTCPCCSTPEAPVVCIESAPTPAAYETGASFYFQRFECPNVAAKNCKFTTKRRKR